MPGTVCQEHPVQLRKGCAGTQLQGGSWVRFISPPLRQSESFLLAVLKYTNELVLHP